MIPLMSSARWSSGVDSCMATCQWKERNSLLNIKAAIKKIRECKKQLMNADLKIWNDAPVFRRMQEQSAVGSNALKRPKVKPGQAAHLSLTKIIHCLITSIFLFFAAA